VIRYLIFLFIAYTSYNFNDKIYQDMRISKLLHKHYFFLALILVLAVCLRLPNLSQPFWGDEILSLQIVRHFQDNISGLFQYLRAVEVHPPLYYLILIGWTKLFGFSEMAVRSLSLIFGLATVALSYFLGKQLWKNARAGLLAALLVAVMPMPIIFSTEARPYIIFSFLGLLCLYKLNTYLDKKHWSQLVYFSIFAIFGLYLHYSFLLILFPLLAWWLFKIIIDKRREDLFRLVLVLASIFLGFYWWLPAMLYKVLLGNYELMNLPRTIFSHRALYFFEASFNQLIWTVKDKQVLPLEILVILVSKLAAAAALLWLLLKKEKEIIFPFLHISFLVIISLVIFLFSPASENYVSIFEKHVFWLSILLALALAGLASRLKTKAAAALISIFIVSFITFDAKILLSQNSFDADRAQKLIAEQINDGFLPGDIVIDNFSYDRSNLNYYLHPHISAYGFYPPQLFDWQNDIYASRNTLGLLENDAQSRIWPVSGEALDLKMNYIIRQTSPTRIWLAYADYQDYGLKRWLEANGWRHAIFSIDRFSPLDLYVKKQ